MEKLQVAVIGLGKLGSACATFLLDETEMALAGVVRRPGSPATLPGRLKRLPSVGHVRDLERVDVALVCVPREDVIGVARELLQARIPIVECATIEARAQAAHYAELDGAGRLYRCAAVVGAGWDPGVLPLFNRSFEILIPHGNTSLHRHPGVTLHHSAVVAQMPGIKDALVGEFRGEGGALQRYVYVELQRGADFGQVRSAIEADPMFAGETTQVFQVGSLSEVEAEAGYGVVLERQQTAAAGVHASLMLEARFDVNAFAARAMIDAAHRVSGLRHGAHRYALGM